MRLDQKVCASHDNKSLQTFVFNWIDKNDTDAAAEDDKNNNMNNSNESNVWNYQ